MTINLTLRRTYNDHPRPEDNDKFWSVDCDGYYVCSLVLTRGASDQPPNWQWNDHMHPGRHGDGARETMALSGRATSRDAALPDIRRIVERYREFIGPEGWAAHVNLMDWLKERKEATRRRENRA